MADLAPPVPLTEVLITEQLMRRRERPILSTFTNAVMVELHRLLAEEPAQFPTEAARAAMILPGAHSAGLSLVTEEPTVFHAPIVDGRWTKHADSAARLQASLCPLALEHRRLLMVSRPERAFLSLQGAYPPIVEALLAPFFIGERPAGVVWAVFHNADLQFDIHDGYMLEELARLVASAHLPARVGLARPEA